MLHGQHLAAAEGGVDLRAGDGLSVVGQDFQDEQDWEKIIMGLSKYGKEPV
jgi:hypothetical protein